MKKIFNLLIDCIRKLFKKLTTGTEKRPPNIVVQVDYIPSPTPVEPSPIDSENKSDKNTGPTKSNLKSTIQSFLWKPEGDHTKKPVILVAADGFNTMDLKCEIIGKSGKVLKGVSIVNAGRGNHLEPYKFSRIHYRITNRTAAQLKKNAPLKVRFFVDNPRVDVLLGNKESISIKDPTHRKDMKKI